VLHVEPDLWGYLEHVKAVALASLFAQQFVRLRDELAPNVLLAYHMSGWGTKHDIVYEDPPDATVRAYAAQSAAFYRALHAKFDVAFEDFSDRDAGFYAAQQGNSKTWFTPADFARHLLYAKTFVRLAGCGSSLGRSRSELRPCARWTTRGTTTRTTACSGSSGRARVGTSVRTWPPASSASCSAGARTARRARATRQATA
jgi:hypothetical protein